MKAMKRILAAVIAFTLIIACADEKEPNLDSNLFGTWTWIYSAYGTGDWNSAPTEISTPATDGCGQQVEFRKNGTFYWQQTGCDEEGDELSRWYVKDSTLVIDDRGEKNYCPYRFVNDTLIVILEDEGDWEIERWLQTVK